MNARVDWLGAAILQTEAVQKIAALVSISKIVININTELCSFVLTRQKKWFVKDKSKLFASCREKASVLRKKEFINYLLNVVAHIFAVCY